MNDQFYHLYTKGNTTNKHYISLFAPNERVGGYDNYVGTFKLNYDNLMMLGNIDKIRKTDNNSNTS